jgi:HIV Tat-specific factor 1
MQKMQGRFFSGRRVEASLWIGKQRFRRSNAAAEDMEDIGGDEGEKKRLEDFAHWLLTEGD